METPMGNTALGIAVVAFGIVVGGQAHAGSEREGLVLGASVGLGAIAPLECVGCDALGGVAFNVRIGGVVIPRLVLMYDGQAVISRDAGTVVTNGTHTFAAQFWPLPRFWVRAGLGLSVLRLASSGVVFRNEGLGATAAVGFEILKSGNFVMDIEAIYSHSQFDGGGKVANVAGLLGFNWY